MKKMKVLCVVTALLIVASASQAALITNVVRANGQSGDRAPIGVFDGATAPMATEEGGLKDGNMVFSDRTYPWANTPAELMGSEYVRTFNTDKAGGETDVTYSVTISQACIVWLTIDDRAWGTFTSQQAADEITKAFATPGMFKDTDLNLIIRESTTVDRPMSVFSAILPAGTYVFGANNSNNNFYTIGAMIPEPMTLSLLALGGLIVARKRS